MSTTLYQHSTPSVQHVDDTLASRDYVAHSASCQHCHQPDSIQRSLSLAKETCTSQGVRFTPLREQVYRLILQSDTPIGAYDLLAKLQKTTEKTLAPPTIYRSLDFLLDMGFIHQLSATKTFFACCWPENQHTATFLICQKCGDVQELSHDTLDNLLNKLADQAQFAIKSSVIELSGICQKCQ
ncbi:FUR family transcriptional regulator [Moraxella macacae 0408225]|uniref:FUR family transcriptional regulator n=1 Tax=Moraxella macacae 0408225 TaxID=1230338 RepID=L2F905_9GAMM|nr:transcriptional repressor [Moraxella macacae]ELA09539.1 FUR family transcriptional regulator [Moraxella macacae 0408225]